MLLRLSRASFWLAALAAAVALWLPTGQETLLTGVALVASGAALLLWRQGLRQRAQLSSAAWAPSGLPALDDPELRDVAAKVEAAALGATCFEAALHAAARLLRSELGAREVTVHQVLELSPTQARLARLIESQPELRFDARWLRLDASSLGQCIARQSEQGGPPGDVLVPILRGGRVDAVLELAGLGISVDAAALARLLALSRLALEGWTPERRSRSLRPEAPAGRAEGSAVHALVHGGRGPDRAGCCANVAFVGQGAGHAPGARQSTLAACRSERARDARRLCEHRFDEPPAQSQRLIQLPTC